MGSITAMSSSAQQLEKLRLEVLKYKDHPALLAWIIGNELNFDYTNSAVYDAVNDISEMIHAVDPNHPTTTTVAGLGENVLQDLEARAGDLDFLSFQAYGEIFNVPEFLSEHAIDRPVWITEWGAIGHWEMERTDWGAPLEMNSSEKAGVYLQAYNEIIAPREGQIVGSFAFLWGQKQERTPPGLACLPNPVKKPKPSMSCTICGIRPGLKTGHRRSIQCASMVSRHGTASDW